MSLAACFLVIFLHYLDAPGPRGALALGLVAGLGVMAKASFLAWAAAAALAILAMLLRRRARIVQVLAFGLTLTALIAPWFLRNYHLHGSFSVMQQTMRGIGIGDTLRAALALPWLETASAQLRAALWTGNSSFTTFSRSTLNVVLVLLGAALAAWAITQARARRADLERWTMLAMGVFTLALAYACAVFHAARAGACALDALAHRGHIPAAGMPECMRYAPRGEGRTVAGRGSRARLCLLEHRPQYVLKLIPLYAGCDTGRMRWRELQTCYVTSGDRTFQLLADTALGPRLGWSSLSPPW